MAYRVAGAKRHELRGPKGQDPYLPREFIHPRDDLPVDYYGTRLMKGQDSYLPRGFIHPRDDHPSTTTVLNL